MFCKLRMVIAISNYNFLLWRKNSRIMMVFLLDFILCYFLTDKAIQFAKAQETTMQVFEAFIWTFGDSDSILLTSLLLLILFADMPFITTATPFYLIRGTKKVWIFGQILYIVLATTLFICCNFIFSVVLTMKNSFIGNKWSRTAALLAYSGEGKKINLPSAVKAIEMSRPYQTVIVIFALLLLYTLVMVAFMMLMNIWKGQVAGIAAAMFFSGYGFLLNPTNIQKFLNLPKELAYKARVIVGWLSPLNHATYYMHNFGYDQLPTLKQTFTVGIVLFVVFIVGTIQAMKKYTFSFSGTEKK